MHSFACTRFLGVDFALADEAAVLAAIRSAASDERFSYVVTPNVDHIVRLHEAGAESAVGRSYATAALTVCDSRIVALLAGWSRVDLPVVPGSDLTARLLDDTRFAGLHCHVIGGSAATLAALAKGFPQFRWSQFVPPHGVLHDVGAQDAIVASIVASGADIVFMAIGFPQSEVVCARALATGRARGVGLCIGASLEFVTGEKSRAPGVFQRLKLEWLYRLLSEPRRLWRRYLVVGPRVFGIWWRERRSLRQRTAV